MLRSMTGFGSAHAVIEGAEYVVEVRSVNHRYMKAIVRLPEIWSGTEAEVERLLRDRLRRGSVTVRVRMRLGEDQAGYRVNAKALKSYLDQIKILEVDVGPAMRIDLGTMLQLPGVCEPPAAEDLCHAAHDGLMRLIGEALDGLVDMRTHEGQALKEELTLLCDQIAAGVEVVRAKAPQVVMDYQQRLTARVTELLRDGRAKIDQDVLAREVAIFAERCDVAEELSRLTGHVAQFRKAVNAETPAGPAGSAGRKLDFIAQEMLREANTIASKANDAETARQVVAMKTAIDRIKEQVANVE